MIKKINNHIDQISKTISIDIQVLQQSIKFYRRKNIINIIHMKTRRERTFLELRNSIPEEFKKEANFDSNNENSKKYPK